MRFRTAPTAAIAALLATLAAAAHADLVVDTGHQGAITALAVEAGRDLLASASSDGAVRIWDLKGRRQEAVLAVSRFPVQRLAIHPVSPLVAAVEAPTPGTARITVWDWSRGTRLYVIDLPDLPLYVAFSTLGTYLVYTRADWQSVTLVDAWSGNPSPYMRQGFGIVSFVAFSRTERNLMAYLPSGRISYFELRTGEILKQVDTTPDLAPRRITEDLGTLLARSQTGIAIVDVATGALLSQQRQPGLVALDFSPDGSRIFVVAGAADGRSNLTQWSYWGGALARTETPGAADLSRMTGSLTALVAAGTSAYVGDERGTIAVLPPYGGPTQVSRSTLEPLTAVAACGDRAAVATPGGAWLFEIATSSRMFGNRTSVGGYHIGQVPLPDFAEPAVKFLDTDMLAAWDRRGRGLVLCTLPSSGQGLGPLDYRVVPADLFGSTLLGVEPAGPGTFLTLEADGTIQLIDRVRLSRLYRTTAPGTRAAAWMSDEALIAARIRMSRLENPLERINTRTGETVPLPDSAFLSYALAADPARGRVFSIAVEKSPGGSASTVRLHEGKGLERIQTVIRYPGEDGGASIALDAEGRTLYSSIGLDGVQSWDGANGGRVEATSHVPRELAVGGRLLLAINADHSLSIWETRNGKLLVDLYLFTDSAWLAVLPQEDRLYSQGADRYILQQ